MIWWRNKIAVASLTSPGSTNRLVTSNPCNTFNVDSFLNLMVHDVVTGGLILLVWPAGSLAAAGLPRPRERQTGSPPLHPHLSPPLWKPRPRGPAKPVWRAHVQVDRLDRSPWTVPVKPGLYTSPRKELRGGCWQTSPMGPRYSESTGEFRPSPRWARSSGETEVRNWGREHPL